MLPQVVLNANVSGMCKYKRKTADFHKFTDENAVVWGFGFYSKGESAAEAEKCVMLLVIVVVLLIVLTPCSKTRFMKAMMQVIDPAGLARMEKEKDAPGLPPRKPTSTATSAPPPLPANLTKRAVSSIDTSSSRGPASNATSASESFVKSLKPAASPALSTTASQSAKVPSASPVHAAAASSTSSSGKVHSKANSVFVPAPVIKKNESDKYGTGAEQALREAKARVESLQDMTANPVHHRR